MTIQGPTEPHLEPHDPILLPVIELLLPFNPLNKEISSLAERLFLPFKNPDPKNMGKKKLTMAHTVRLVSQALTQVLTDKEKLEGKPLVKTGTSFKNESFSFSHLQRETLSLHQVKMALQTLSSLIRNDSVKEGPEREKFETVIHQLIQAIGKQQEMGSSNQSRPSFSHEASIKHKKEKKEAPKFFSEKASDQKLSEKHKVSSQPPQKETKSSRSLENKEEAHTEKNEKEWISFFKPQKQRDLQNLRPIPEILEKDVEHTRSEKTILKEAEKSKIPVKTPFTEKIQPPLIKRSTEDLKILEKQEKDPHPSISKLSLPPASKLPLKETVPPEMEKKRNSPLELQREPKKSSEEKRPILRGLFSSHSMPEPEKKNGSSSFQKPHVAPMSSPIAPKRESLVPREVTPEVSQTAKAPSPPNIIIAPYMSSPFSPLPLKKKRKKVEKNQNQSEADPDQEWESDSN